MNAEINLFKNDRNSFINTNIHNQKFKNKRFFIFLMFLFNLFIIFLIKKQNNLMKIINYKTEIILKEFNKKENFTKSDIINNLEKRLLNYTTYRNNLKENNLENNNLTFNQNSIINIFIKEQNDFCDNPKKYFNEFYENQIELKKARLKKFFFQIYMFKTKKTFMTDFLKTRTFEKIETLNIIKALKYYRKKKSILHNKDIFVIDVGGNIGWYSSLLGRLGYSILSFEPLERNYYVSIKNYCQFNRNSNVIIVNKGLNTEEMSCDYYEDVYYFSNGMVICNKTKIYDKQIRKRFKKISKIKLTKLSYFFPYLKDKNVALIKLDVEGSEGKAIESGIELITKFHVPFIILEFTPTFLLEHGTDPEKFLKLFVDNGYKISVKGFINNKFITIENFMKIVRHHINCYFINKDIL